jgi:hypothetical protein
MLGPGLAFTYYVGVASRCCLTIGVIRGFLWFINHLLSMPADDGEFERLDVQPRDFE